MIRRSVVLSAIVPQSATDSRVLSDALSILEKTRTDTIELYTPFDMAREMGKVIEDSSIDCDVYPIAGVQKTQGYSLCDLDENKRQEALTLVKRAIESARILGAGKVLITTGRYPGKEEERKALDLFIDSALILSREAENMEIVLETGDRTVDARQLLGPTDLSLEITEEIRRSCPNFFLTLDTSHLAQLGEEVELSLEKGIKFSDHVHFASCILKEGHPLYGDKHPHFSDADNALTGDRLERIFRTVSSWGEEKDILCGHEVIDRTGERLGSLERAIAEAPWFF